MSSVCRILNRCSCCEVYNRFYFPTAEFRLRLPAQKNKVGGALGTCGSKRRPASDAPSSAERLHDVYDMKLRLLQYPIKRTNRRKKRPELVSGWPVMCCCPPLQPLPTVHSDVSVSRGQTSACAALWECDTSGRKNLHGVTQTSPPTWRKYSKYPQKNFPRRRDGRGGVGGHGGACINPPSKWKRAAGLTRHFHGIPP